MNDMSNEETSRTERQEELGNAAGERSICTIRPAMFRAHPFRYLLIVLLAIGGIVLAVTAFIKSPDDQSFQPWMLWPGLLITAASAIWWFYWWMASTLWMRLEISDKRTIRHEGIVRRHSTEVLHDHVRSVDINQTFLQRIFNVGYIGIDSAGQDGIEIEVRDIPAPYDVKAVIDRYREM